jgi:mRNA-degrading endonuclease RelE of RelBE toxin-antitoxin system
MTDKIKKSLAKFSAKERAQISTILKNLIAENYTGLNLLKLKGSKDIFRVRKGDIRIIFRKDKSGTVKVLAIERRAEATYRNY